MNPGKKSKYLILLMGVTMHEKDNLLSHIYQAEMQINVGKILV